MTIYLDKDFMCHLQPTAKAKEVETEMFDGFAPSVIEQYRFIPENMEWHGIKGVYICSVGNPKEMNEAQKNYQDGINSQDETIAELMDEIASLCEELIGE